MEEAKTMKTLMSSSIKLDKDEKGKPIDSTMYRGMIGRLEPRVSVLDCIFFLPCVIVRATYGIGGPIICAVRGVKIRLDLESICRIFYIAPVGLKVYESKIWPIVPEFELREVIQRICELANAQGMGKPSVHSLTVISRVLHCMMDPLGVPNDDAHDLMLREHNLRTPYGRFLTRVFKDAEVDLRRETDFEPSFIEPPYTEIPPHQAPHALDYASWMDLSTQIGSFDTRMEELAIVSDTWFYSMEDCMDQYQTSFTSLFEYLQQRFKRIEDHMDQHQVAFDHLQ
ncbi:hypothetical protein CK203_046708 [Vitis vinifera]|uniref:Uncharacterized protein n=1 Tax=Vitis vinifera TaxID=29760 RepID=A0A438HJY5_VITVI|nr:hypothetical protein CK203_046708 [Vitis vinifera]